MILKLKQFLVAFTAFIIIDLVWLGVIASSFYQDQLGDLMADNVIWPAAILFYILFVVGILYFSVIPALKKKSLDFALKNAALYGFFTYMTYELTNYSVLQDWPFALVVVDIIWGVVLSTSVAWVAYVILSRQKLF